MIYTVEKFTDKIPSQDAINVLILKRFREEGIEIPFPTRVIYQKAEGLRLRGETIETDRRLSNDNI